MLCVPALTGIRVNNDRLVGRGAELCDERGDEPGVGTVNAYGDGLRKGGYGGSALTKEFAVSHVLVVAAGKREPGCEFGMGRERLADRFGFGERRQCFEGKEVCGFGWRRGGEHVNACAVEFDEIVEGAGVVAVIFRAVMERCAVGAEGCSDKDAALGIESCGLAGECYGTEERGVRTRWIEADFGVAHARQLIACGFDDVCSGLDVGAMHRDDFLRCIFKHVCGPQRTFDVGAEILKFGGHAAVEDVKPIQERLTSI